MIEIRRDNTSGYIGVTFRKDCITKPWRAVIQLPGKKRNLGYYATPEEASKAYQAAKKERDEKEIERCKSL